MAFMRKSMDGTYSIILKVMDYFRPGHFMVRDNFFSFKKFTELNECKTSCHNITKPLRFPLL